jgi:hypothetical protein
MILLQFLGRKACPLALLVGELSATAWVQGNSSVLKSHVRITAATLLQRAGVRVRVLQVGYGVRKDERHPHCSEKGAKIGPERYSRIR